jgi:hypothetical protein
MKLLRRIAGHALDELEQLDHRLSPKNYDEVDDDGLDRALLSLPFAIMLPLHVLVSCETSTSHVGPQQQVMHKRGGDERCNAANKDHQNQVGCGYAAIEPINETHGEPRHEQRDPYYEHRAQIGFVVQQEARFPIHLSTVVGFQLELDSHTARVLH